MKPHSDKHRDAYASLSNDELVRLGENVQSITIEARSALRAELESRKLSVKNVNWGARSPGSHPPRRVPNVVGDEAGEHLQMNRGRFSAWPHVIIAFFGEIALLSWVLRVIGVKSDAAIPISLCLTIAIYWDRLKVIEAYTSEFCSGVANVSLFVAPFAAFFYSNYRGVRKLSGR